MTPEPPATEVIRVNAVNQQGQLREGYELDDEPAGAGIDAENCSEGSSAGMSPNTYACNASVFSADACWRQADGDLACLDLPWERKLSRRSIDGDLPETAAADGPEPIGLQLEDGSRYRQRNGMSAGTAPADLNDVYYCVSGPCGDDPDKLIAVLAARDKPVVDGTSDAWTVLVGELLRSGADEKPSLPAPRAQRVARAWFITAE